MSGYYTEGVAYTFDVIEYLKGSGDDQLSVLDYHWSRKRPECRERFGTEQEAIAAAAPELELGQRDTSIEGREAIIFLVANQHSEGSAYAYELTHADPARDPYQYRDPYVTSQPAWMPGAEVTSGEPVHGEAAGSLIFRSVTPDTRATETAAPTTLAELRTLVTEVVEDYRTGSAEHGEEDYYQCLLGKYRLQRTARWADEPGARRGLSVNSGAPAGTRITGTERWGSRPKEYMSGADAHLFSNQPAPFFATRPIPLGEYRFYHTGFDPNWLAICGGPDELPESLRESREFLVRVTAPEGVLHEAFFDPVASGDAVGAGGADGVLKPAAFTLNGSQTTMRRIEWESGRVVMRLEPHDSALADHHVDFISLDGSVALRLDFDDAVEATLGGTPALAWGVCNQPWSEGDLLMLRIRESEADLTGATRDADCPATATTQTPSGGTVPASPGGASPPAPISVPPPFSVPPGLEEQILRAAVIARVRLRSVSAPTQRGDKGIKCNFHYAYGWLAQSIITDVGAQSDEEGGYYYNNGIVYTFDVIEYLKGEGDGELVVLEPGFIRGPVECRDRFDTEEAALEAAALAVERRDTRWEDREAIIFVQANFYPNQDAAKGSYPYEFMLADPDSQSATITDKAWLPAAEAGGGAPVLGQAAGAMRFLSATPDSRVTEAAAPRTLAELRTLVAEAVENYRTGSAEHGEELYKQCLIQKYTAERWARWRLYHRIYHHRIDSGLPAGTQIIGPEILGPGRTTPPIGLKVGRDAHLFSTDPTMFHTVRPLPRGEYRFYHTGFDPNRLPICGGDVMPEAMRKSAEDIVEVTAPEGVVHEAFFDPVASGDAVGAGGADGVLTWAGFTLRHSTLWRATRNGCYTIIRRIEWESGRVVMRLEPDDNALASHHVDFIALDGSVALRLDFDDAAEATSGGAPALAWSVRNQPWSEGDLLMLRISRSEANLIGASGDAECPPPGPPAARPSATPSAPPGAVGTPTPP